jgi:hypothetical protein
MLRASRSFIVGSLLLCPCLALADTGSGFSGNDLLKWCKELVNESSSNYFDAGKCFGFVQGVISGWEGGIASTTSNYAEYQKRSLICLPAGVIRGQTARVAIQYLEEKPAELHKDAAILAALAIIKAFPCAKP